MIEYPKDLEDFNKMYNELNLLTPIYETNIDLKCHESFWDIFTSKFLEAVQGDHFLKEVHYSKVKFKSIYVPDYGQITRI